MEVLLVTPYFYPHQGGSQQYAQELFAHLIRKNLATKVDVICYNTDKAPDKEIYKGLTIYRIPCFQILSGQFALPNYFALFKKLNELLKNNSYTFINSHTRFFENSWWVPLVAKWYKIPSVLTDHCAYHPTHKSPLVSVIAKTIDRLITPLISHWYDVVTVTNRATYDFVVAMGMKKPTIIYGGVDTDFFKPSEKKATKLPNIKKQFSQKDIIITFLGRMIPSKGPQVLLEAALPLLKKYPHVSLVFAGSGEMYSKLQPHASNQIFFTNTLFMDDIQKLLSSTDILVHPSLHHEGFPNVLLEAGAAGVAIIASGQGGTKEIIQDQKTGLLVKPTTRDIQNALEELIQNPQKRHELGTNVRKHVEKNFSWKKIVTDFERLIATEILNLKS